MILREINETDVNFIFSSLLKSLRPYKSNVSNDIYYTNEHRRAQHMLLNSLTMVLVDPADETRIIGYAVASVVPEVQVTLHYVYIKKEHRNKGLAHLLITTVLDNLDSSMPRYCSNFTPLFTNLMKTYNFMYNPYIHDLQLGA